MAATPEETAAKLASITSGLHSEDPVPPLLLRNDPIRVMICNVIQEPVPKTIRRLLAFELEIDPSTITDSFDWVNECEEGDAEVFLCRVNEKFTNLRPGFSFGSGTQPFPVLIDKDLLEEISTVGRLIAFLESYLDKNRQATFSKNSL
jgi:hypothetical protein